MQVVNFASRKFLAGIGVCLLLLTMAYVYVILKDLTSLTRQHISSIVLTNQQGQLKASHSPEQQQSGNHRSFRADPEVTPRPAYLHVIDPESLYVVNNTATRDITNNCRLTRTRPAFQVCLYPSKIDKYISASLISYGVWEPGFTSIFQLALSRFPQATVVDAGSNIGYYSLMAAAMGHQVVAVEPTTANMKRLARGVQVNGFTDKVTVLYNALAESHKNVSMGSSMDNQGEINVQKKSNGTGNVQTILMDDLLHFIQTHDVIIKMDIEGYECRALAGSNKLFRNVYVPYIFMEWFIMRGQRNDQSSYCPTAALRELTDTFVRLGYQPHDLESGADLDPQISPDWPATNVYWKHWDQPRLIQPQK